MKLKHLYSESYIRYGTGMIKSWINLEWFKKRNHIILCHY